MKNNIKDLKDLAFYCLRNLTPIGCNSCLEYATDNTQLSIYKLNTKTLQVHFNYKANNNCTYFISDSIDITEDELTEFEFTRICAKNDLFDNGLKMFNQDVSNKSN